MTQASSPADMQKLIVERLTGARGDPSHVVEAARACGERVLASLQDTMADAFSSALGLEMQEVEIARLGDCRPDAGSHAAMTIVAAETSPDAMVIALDATMIAICVSAFFGGDPDDRVLPIRRALTGIEREVAGRVSDMLAEAFNGTGSRAFRIRQPLPRPVTGDEIAKRVIRDGPAALIRYQIVFGESAGVITIAVPQRVLLSLRGEATASAKPAPPGRWRARFSEEVIRSTVSLEATIPLPRMTLADIVCMLPGQVIELPAHAQGATRLAARDKTLFNCEFGKLGQNYTVRLIEAFDAEQDLVDSIVRPD